MKERQYLSTDLLATQSKMLCGIYKWTHPGLSALQSHAKLILPEKLKMHYGAHHNIKNAAFDFSTNEMSHPRQPSDTEKVLLNLEDLHFHLPTAPVTAVSEQST